MTRVNIPVVAERRIEGGLTLMLSFVGVFLLGATLGALWTTHATTYLSDETATLASVVASGDENDSPVTEGPTSVPLDNIEVGLTDEFIDAPLLQELPLAEETEETSELAPIETEVPGLSPDLRVEYTREIERIRSDSISLIAEFRQNCGVWADSCAEPYQKILDKHNARYLELERLLRR